MKLQKTVYQVSKTTFGMSHLIFQTLADLSLDAEMAVTRRTGIYHGNTRIECDQAQESNLRLQRLKKTATTQQDVNERIARFKSLINKPKLRTA